MTASYGKLQFLKDLTILDRLSGRIRTGVYSICLVILVEYQAQKNSILNTLYRSFSPNSINCPINLTGLTKY